MSRLRQRRDQLTELTGGLQLPLPSLSAIHLDIILEGLISAWEELAKTHGDELLKKDEPEINALMQARLNRATETETLFGQMVSNVARGSETVSFDGTHIEKRPDLAVYLTRRHANFPLLIECKIIDRRCGKGVNLYCMNGLKRFVEGEYAWANREAMMVAYVRDRSHIDGTLTPYLSALTANPPDSLRTESVPQQEGTLIGVVTRHGRAFQYTPPCLGSLPGPIAIWHLWIPSHLTLPGVKANPEREPLAGL